MKKLVIYEFQAKNIEDTLRIVANNLMSHGKATCLDRDVMQCWETIKNIIAGEPDKRVSR